jgi:hypothetical protein
LQLCRLPKSKKKKKYFLVLLLHSHHYKNYDWVTHG